MTDNHHRRERLVVLDRYVGDGGTGTQIINCLPQDIAQRCLCIDSACPPVAAATVP
ncbi:hypothetical protein ACFV23_02205 [Streptomyces sp. NPDC059627]